MSDPAPRAISVEEYLRTEEKSPHKREYVGGFVYPLHGQAGASEGHVLIAGNIFGVLYRDAIQAGCRLYQSVFEKSDEASHRHDGHGIFAPPPLRGRLGGGNADDLPAHFTDNEDPF